MTPSDFESTIFWFVAIGGLVVFGVLLVATVVLLIREALTGAPLSPHALSWLLKALITWAILYAVVLLVATFGLLWPLLPSLDASAPRA